MDNKCGCGKPVRYIKIIASDNPIGSCNKYGRCLTYEELEKTANELSTKNKIYEYTLQKIVDTDAEWFEYKTWAKDALKWLLNDNMRLIWKIHK